MERAVRLLIHDTLATAFVAYPIRAGWFTPAVAVDLEAALPGSRVGPDDAALIPSAEIALLGESHVVHPGVAVVADQHGLVSLRTPARPDEIDPTPVLLHDVSGSAELLARATVEPFYGIRPTGWTREADPDARAVIVEGPLALQAPEAGYAEDLVRAWFILTGQPFVSHLLAVPRGAGPDQVEAALAALTAALAMGHERRRDLRRALAEEHDLDRDALNDALAAQRYRLEPDDRRALLMLLQKGNRGSAYPYPWHVPYVDDGTQDEAPPEP